MAFTDDETHSILELLEREFWSHRRPPLHLRDKMREGQRFAGQSIELFYERPTFLRPGEWHEESIAKITYVRSRDVWNLYWQRADLKWHRYPECPETESLSAALAVIHEDAFSCFFG